MTPVRQNPSHCATSHSPSRPLEPARRPLQRAAGADVGTHWRTKTSFDGNVKQSRSIAPHHGTTHAGACRREPLVQRLQLESFAWGGDRSRRSPRETAARTEEMNHEDDVAR